MAASSVKLHVEHYCLTVMLSVRRNATGTPFSGVWSQNVKTLKLRPALFIHLQQKSLCIALTDLSQSQHLYFHNL